MSYENYLEGINNIKSRYGTIQQVDLDGTLSGGVITFVPDTNFAPTNNMMYKFVLTFSAVARPTFDSEMVLNLDGTNNLPILSIFNKSTATNTTVQQMKEVEEYNNETGFKWVFLAIYNEVENGGTITRAVSIPASLSNPQGFILVVDDDQITHYTMDGGLLNGQVVFNEDSGKFLKFTTDGTNHSFTEYVIAPTSLPATGAKLSGSIPNTVEGGLVAQEIWQSSTPQFYTNGFTFNVDHDYRNATQLILTRRTGESGTPSDVILSTKVVVGENVRFQNAGYTYWLTVTPTTMSAGTDYQNQYMTKVSDGSAASYSYTISNAAIKANSLAEMYVDSETPVTAVSKADGSVIVSVPSLPSAAIPYTLQVVETSAEGVFEIINSYAPEVPTSLPATSAKLSGSIAVADWEINTNWETNYPFIDTVLASRSNTSYDLSGLEFDIGDVLSIKAIVNGVEYTATATAETFSPYGSMVDFSSSDIPIRFYRYERNYTPLQLLVENASTRYSVTIKGINKNGETLTSATISNAVIKANSLAEMYVNSETPITAVSKADGSLVVSVLSLPSAAIPYTLQVVETSAEGALEIINSYVPEVPTSLPAKSAKLSGSIATTDWDTNALSYQYTGAIVNSHVTLGTFTMPLSVGDSVKCAGDGWEQTVTATTGPNGITVVNAYPIQLYFNCRMVGNSLTYAEGYLTAWTDNANYTSGTYQNLTTPESIYTYALENAAIKVNSFAYLKIGVNVTGEKTDGAITLTSETLPTAAVSYDLQIIETDTDGSLEIINNTTIDTTINQLGDQTSLTISTGGNYELCNVDSLTITATTAVNILVKGTLGALVLPTTAQNRVVTIIAPFYTATQPSDVSSLVSGSIIGNTHYGVADIALT